MQISRCIQEGPEHKELSGNHLSSLRATCHLLWQEGRMGQPGRKENSEVQSGKVTKKDLINLTVFSWFSPAQPEVFLSPSFILGYSWVENRRQWQFVPVLVCFQIQWLEVGDRTAGERARPGRPWGGGLGRPPPPPVSPDERAHLSRHNKGVKNNIMEDALRKVESRHIMILH